MWVQPKHLGQLAIILVIKIFMEIFRLHKLNRQKIFSNFSSLRNARTQTATFIIQIAIYDVKFKVRWHRQRLFCCLLI